MWFLSFVCRDLFPDQTCFWSEYNSEVSFFSHLSVCPSVCRWLNLKMKCYNFQDISVVFGRDFYDRYMVVSTKDIRFKAKKSLFCFYFLSGFWCLFSCFFVFLHIKYLHFVYSSCCLFVFFLFLFGICFVAVSVVSFILSVFIYTYLAWFLDALYTYF